MAQTGETITYAELEACENRLAHLFRAKGLKRLDHCAIFMENNSRYVECCGADETSGLYYTYVNSFLTPEELAYRDRLASDADLATAVHKFTKYWPIFCNGDIGLLGLWPNVQAWYPDGRAATARELKKYDNKSAIRKPDGSLRPGVRRRPRNDNFDVANPSWPDTLETLYQVRNNLMHGTKGFDGDDDEIIEGAYDTLDGFVRGSDLYGWR